MNSTEILDRVKLFLNAKSDIELSKKLGKFPNYIYQLKKRNNIDIDVLIEACPDADFNWLLTGKKDKLNRIAELDSKGNRVEIELTIDEKNNYELVRSYNYMHKKGKLKSELEEGEKNNNTSAVELIDSDHVLADTMKQMQEKDATIQEMSKSMLQLQRLLAEYQLKEKKE